MIRMAVLALGIYYFFVYPMETFVPLDVGTNLFMAIETELLLRSLLKGAVALGALLLVFGMALDDRAWIDQVFKDRGFRTLKR